MDANGRVREQRLAQNEDRSATSVDRGRSGRSVRAVEAHSAGNAVLSPACAARAFDPQHVQLAGDIAEGEIGPGHESVERLDP